MEALEYGLHFLHPVFGNVGDHQDLPLLVQGILKEFGLMLRDSRPYQRANQATRRCANSSRR